LNQSIQEPVDAGIAVFAGDTGLLVRRQGGRFFVVRASIVGAEALSGLTTASPSFSIGPAAITVSPWAPCIDVSPARAAPAECVRAKGSIPSGAGTLDLAELPNLQLSFVDADGQGLSHMECDSCVTADLNMLPGQGDACALLGIPDQDPTCAPDAVEWPRVAGKVCNKGSPYCPFDRNGCTGTPCKKEVDGAKSLEQCIAACAAESDCVAVTFYPPEVHNQLGFGVPCLLAMCACTQSQGQVIDGYSGSVYIRPASLIAAGVSDECTCPSETVGGRVYTHLILSDQVSVGTRHVAARNVTDGVASFSSLYTRFRHSAAFSVSLSLSLGGNAAAIEASTAPLILLPTPPDLAYRNEVDEAGLCACASREGFGLVTLLDAATTAEGPLQRAINEYPSYSLQALVEMQALSCQCTIAAANKSTCRGCCDPVCWYADEAAP